jgi:hypothetical protein
VAGQCVGCVALTRRRQPPPFPPVQTGARPLSVYIYGATSYRAASRPAMYCRLRTAGCPPKSGRRYGAPMAWFNPPRCGVFFVLLASPSTSKGRRGRDKSACGPLKWPGPPGYPASAPNDVLLHPLSAWVRPAQAVALCDHSPVRLRRQAHCIGVVRISSWYAIAFTRNVSSALHVVCLWTVCISVW